MSALRPCRQHFGRLFSLNHHSSLSVCHGLTSSAAQRCSKSVLRTSIMAKEEILIDGSMLEGGGQILRNSTALAAIRRVPLVVNQIRAGRRNPGLRPQHLCGITLITEMCGGCLKGGEVGSSNMRLVPGKLKAGNFVADTKTAGSCTLVAQAALPCLLLTAPTNDCAATGLEVRGGTDADMAPPVSYFMEVVVPLLRRILGVKVDLQLVRRGFYPKGGGVVKLTAEPLAEGSCLPAFNLSQPGQVTCVTLKAFTAGRVRAHVAGRMISAAEHDLRVALGSGVKIETHVTTETKDSAIGDGAGISLVAATDTGCILGATAQGEGGVPAEAVGSNGASELVDAIRSKAGVDKWMQDQLIIFMALAQGTSRFTCTEPSLHTRTAIAVAQQMLPNARFTVRELQGTDPCLFMIECEGAGLARS